MSLRSPIPGRFQHPMLRLLEHEFDPSDDAQCDLRQAKDDEALVSDRVRALARFFAREASSPSPMPDFRAATLELAMHLRLRSLDPRLVELIQDCAPNIGRRTPARPGPTPAGLWLRELAGTDLVVSLLSKFESLDEGAWNSTQAECAIRLFKQGLLDRHCFTSEEALTAFVEWVQPLWSILLDTHAGDLMAATYYAETGTFAQICLRNRLDAEQPQSSTPERGTAPASPHAPGHVVIPGRIPPSEEKTDRATLAIYEDLRSPLPLTPVPSRETIEAAAKQLGQEFPWAKAALAPIIRDALARSVLGARAMGAPNLLLVGPPGTGKSRLARRVAEVFGLSFLPLPFSGIGDSKMLAGTARGWAGAQPSQVITFMLNARCANPWILIDEIDKASPQGGHHGAPSPTEQLLTLLEKETSSAWNDLFLQTPCDLSKVMWVATANSITHLPAPLRSRFDGHIVEIPAPSAADLRQVLPYIAQDIAAEWGVPLDALPAKLPDSLVTPNVRSARTLKVVARAYLNDAVLAQAYERPRPHAH